ncbi:MAG TPA: ATP-binding protein, partial [Rhizomicrobium sp.]|nr:ATP-binding protein [Rhizomicrobium sp.]
MSVKPLAADRLCLKTDPARLPFDTTANLPEAAGPVGQERAMRAVDFGARIAQGGYNIFVTGPQGCGKHSAVSRALAAVAASMPAAPDWCYVHNFEEPHRPRALRFAAGQGGAFKSAMGEFVETLREAMPRLFESETYRTRRSAIEEEFRKAADNAFDGLRRRAEDQGLALVERDDGSFDFKPQRDGLVLSDEDFRRLSKTERERLNARTGDLRGALERAMDDMNGLRRHAIERVQALDRELGEAELRKLLAPVSTRFSANREAHDHIEAVFHDVMAHFDALEAEAHGETGEDRKDVPYHRYEVNLLVDNSAAKGAPVVTLPLPSLSHLIGKVEHVPLLVTIITDFMFIRAGALHKANGGFLLIDAMDLLQQDVSWETLKRALRQAQVKIENLAEILDRSQTVTIQPEPIPLDIKIVLFGEEWLFWRLRELDPDFAEFFKVQADFSTRAERNDENCLQLMRLLSGV